MKINLKLVFAGLGISLFSFSIASDIVSQLGLKHATAQDHILKNFVGDFRNSPLESAQYKISSEMLGDQLNKFKIPKASQLAAVMSGDKKAATIELCQYIKDYVNTKEFVDQYQMMRAKAKPTQEPYQMSKEQIQAFEKNMIEAEKAIKASAAYVDAQQLAEAKKVIAEKRAEFQEMKNNPTPNKTLWEKVYPEDPELMVKNRLNEYLALSKTVNFDAELKQVGSKKKFVNPQYENKSLKWKAIYRAGKDANVAATAFIQDWLKGDIIADVKKPLVTETATSASSSNSNSNVQDANPENKTTEKKNKTINVLKNALGL